MDVGTRSQVKEMIKKGRVTVNGTIAGRPETKISAGQDQVCVDGTGLSYVEYVYYMLYKPAGCVSATEDSLHETVLDHIGDVPKRSELFPVGRLDLDTEGLLLMTNDGALAHDLLAPGRHVPKTYYAKVKGQITSREVDLFAEGMDIGEKRLTQPAKLEILRSAEESEVLVTISEGKFHQIKRMFACVGSEVTYLKRLSMGSLQLDEQLQPGEYRSLTEEEISDLRNRKG